MRVSFDDITTVPSDSTYGWVYVKITTPDGRTFEGKSDFIRLRAE